MCKTQCPRCKNEGLKGGENYCPICGLNLKERTALKRLTQEQLEEINNGSKTINQIRKVYGLEPLECGDKLHHRIIL